MDNDRYSNGPMSPVGYMEEIWRNITTPPIYTPFNYLMFFRAYALLVQYEKENAPKACIEAFKNCLTK